MNPKRSSHQHTVRWTMQGLMELFFNITGCCNFTRAKSYEVCSFIGQRAISQKQNDSCSKTLCLALEYIKNCRAGVLFVALGCLDGQILVQKFTKFNHLYMF